MSKGGAPTETRIRVYVCHVINHFPLCLFKTKISLLSITKDRLGYPVWTYYLGLWVAYLYQVSHCSVFFSCVFSKHYITISVTQPRSRQTVINQKRKAPENTKKLFYEDIFRSKPNKNTGNGVNVSPRFLFCRGYKIEYQVYSWAMAV